MQSDHIVHGCSIFKQSLMRNVELNSSSFRILVNPPSTVAVA